MIVHRISCAAGSHSLPALAHRNWLDAEDVHVSFDIHHRGSSILLKFLVEEPQVKALATELNGPVWKDSCVEFFLSIDGDNSYYNFEFNAIGTLHSGYGPNRHNRELIPAESAALIETTPSLGKGIILNLEGPIKWELEVVIPVKSFWKHEIGDMAGTSCRANFYKCGDDLDKPHYLSWKPVETEKPNFHLPEFFGKLEFGK